MFKLVFLLCLMIFATLYTLGGRESGPVRDGLAGKIAPLTLPRDEQAEAPPTRVASAEAPAKAPTAAAPAPAAVQAAAPRPVAPAEDGSGTSSGAGSVLAAAFTQPAETGAEETETGLTLALPLVRPATEAAADPAPEPEPVAAAPEEPAVEPVVLYVTANTVNVRSGPSAETESLTRLSRGEAVLALPSDTPGWSRIRIEGDGVEGFIASRFLGEPQQDGLFDTSQ